MGKMTKEKLLESLEKEKVDMDLSNQYVSAFLEYQEAQANIEKNGSVVAHPRTANIMPNPYLKIRDAADARMLRIRDKIGAENADWVWRLWASK